jgi:hypothetical protein
MIVLDSFNGGSLKVAFAAIQSRIAPVAVQELHIALFFKKVANGVPDTSTQTPREYQTCF